MTVFGQGIPPMNTIELLGIWVAEVGTIFNVLSYDTVCAENQFNSFHGEERMGYVLLYSLHLI